jgi:hypothetical protein
MRELRVLEIGPAPFRVSQDVVCRDVCPSEFLFADAAKLLLVGVPQDTPLFRCEDASVVLVLEEREE